MRMKAEDSDRETKQITVEAVAGNLDIVIEFVNELLKRLGCPLKVQTGIDIAIDELFGNIAHYAYGSDTGPVTVRADATGCVDPEVAGSSRAVTISFIDQGTPFNPLSWPEPDVTLSAEKRKVGGLGIYIVKKSMDEVSYEYKEGKNILRVKKHF